MIGYLIDVENGMHGKVNISDEKSHLEQFYRLIGCDCIDIAVRSIGGKHYNVVLDDEGWLYRDPITSAIDERCYASMLAGNLLIFGINDNDGDLDSLTPDDVANIKKNLMVAIDADREKMYAVAVMGY